MNRSTALILSLLVAAPAGAAEAPVLSLDLAGGSALAQPLRIVLLLTVLALLPAVVIAMTSFTRTIIVLSMLRHAFGMQDTPPNMVLVSLALFLTLFTMAPAIQESTSTACSRCCGARSDRRRRSSRAWRRCASS